MVDVSDKNETRRMARAAGHVRMAEATRRQIAARALPKGDVFTLARVAGVLAAKRTGEAIPLCHPLPLTDVQVDLRLDETGVAIEARTVCVGRTGVEMEALSAVAGAALNKGMMIENIRLLEKTGGRSGDWRRDDEGP
jgi:cyclic pyranopterin phosphate synthase